MAGRRRARRAGPLRRRGRRARAADRGPGRPASGRRPRRRHPGGHLRQLGGHAAARSWDARGLRLAVAAGGAAPDRGSARGGSPGGRGTPGGGVAGAGLAGAAPCAGADTGSDDGTDAAAARIDALVGLAADAIGLGDPTGAERLLAAAAPALAAHPSWRPATRACWVRAELALVLGRPAEALAPAEAALAAARRGGSLRHVLKSRIVLAVARSAAGVTTRRGRRHRVGRRRRRVRAGWDCSRCAGPRASPRST